MGLDWDQLEVRLNVGGYSQWEGGVKCSRTWSRPHSEKDNDVWIFDTGRCVMDMLNGKTPLHKNSIIWMRPWHKYTVEQDPDDPIGLIYIHFDLIRPDGSLYYPEITELPETFECFNHAHWSAMARNILRIQNLGSRGQFPEHRENMDKTLSVLMKSLLMGIEFCDSLARSEHSSVETTNLIAIQAAEYLSEDLHKFQAVRTVAQHFGLSRNHFTRIFTDFWHVTPQDYLIDQRIRRAKDLLANSDQSLEKIAEILGYSDRFFFSRQFKEKTGITPGSYRRQSSGDQKENSTV